MPWIQWDLLVATSPERWRTNAAQASGCQQLRFISWVVFPIFSMNLKFWNPWWSTVSLHPGMWSLVRSQPAERSTRYHWQRSVCTISILLLGSDWNYTVPMFNESNIYVLKCPNTVKPSRKLKNGRVWPFQLKYSGILADQPQIGTFSPNLMGAQCTDAWLSCVHVKYLRYT